MNQQSELREAIVNALHTYNMDTTAGGMNEDKATGYFTEQIESLITKACNEARQDELRILRGSKWFKYINEDQAVINLRHFDTRFGQLEEGNKE